MNPKHELMLDSCVPKIVKIGFIIEKALSNNEFFNYPKINSISYP